MGCHQIDVTSCNNCFPCVLKNVLIFIFRGRLFIPFARFIFMFLIGPLDLSLNWHFIAAGDWVSDSQIREASEIEPRVQWEGEGVQRWQTVVTVKLRVDHSHGRLWSGFFASHVCHVRLVQMGSQLLLLRAMMLFLNGRHFSLGHSLLICYRMWGLKHELTHPFLKRLFVFFSTF